MKCRLWRRDPASALKTEVLIQHAAGFAQACQCQIALRIAEPVAGCTHRRDGIRLHRSPGHA